MPQCFVLQEDSFSLEFRTISGLSAETGSPADILGSDGYVLKEWIIVPQHLSGKAAGFSVHAVAPPRCNAPLIFIGHPALPVQYNSIIARPGGGNTAIEKHDTAVKIVAEGMRLLFSAPIIGRSDATATEFYSAFDRIRGVLSSCHMKESEIARTWIFMEDTLRDYDLLNEAREHFFKKWFPFADHVIPASTGIQGRIIGTPFIAIEFCAFSGDRISIRRQPSPLQNEPTTYGKLFSRALTVRFPRNSLIFISGTAPIDKTGKSVHAGNFERQMMFTLETLSAILHDAGGDFSNIVQAAVYLKRSEDMGSAVRILDEAKFPHSRSLFQVDVDVCRDDLLCEIEATAVIAASEKASRYHASGDFILSPH